MWFRPKGTGGGSVAAGGGGSTGAFCGGGLGKTDPAFNMTMKLSKYLVSGCDAHTCQFWIRIINLNVYLAMLHLRLHSVHQACDPVLLLAWDLLAEQAYLMANLAHYLVRLPLAKLVPGNKTTILLSSSE